VNQLAVRKDVLSVSLEEGQQSGKSMPYQDLGILQGALYYGLLIPFVFRDVVYMI
jgi:hypothetical protein